MYCKKSFRVTVLFFNDFIYRKRDVPCCNKKLPYNHNAADQSADNDIYSKYSYRCSKVMIYRNQP